MKSLLDRVKELLQEGGGTFKAKLKDGVVVVVYSCYGPPGKEIALYHDYNGMITHHDVYGKKLWCEDLILPKRVAKYYLNVYGKSPVRIYSSRETAIKNAGASALVIAYEVTIELPE